MVLRASRVLDCGCQPRYGLCSDQTDCWAFSAVRGTLFLQQSWHALLPVVASTNFAHEPEAFQRISTTAFWSAMLCVIIEYPSHLSVRQIDY